MTPEQHLSRNLTALMEADLTLNSGAKVAKRAAVDQKTVWRMVAMADNSPTLERISKVAQVFGIEAWQLLAPNLGAELYAIDGQKRLAPLPVPKAVWPVENANKAPAPQPVVAEAAPGKVRTLKVDDSLRPPVLKGLKIVKRTPKLKRGNNNGDE